MATGPKPNTDYIKAAARALQTQTKQPKVATKKIQKPTKPKYSAAQQQYIKEIGFTPSDIPDVRKPFSKMSAKEKAFNIITAPITRPVQGLSYAALKEINRRQKTQPKSVGEAVKKMPKEFLRNLIPPITLARMAPDIIRGATGPISVSGSDIAARMFEDPEVLKQLSPTAKKVVTSKPFRAVTGFGLETVLDPYTYMGVGLLKGPAKAIGKATGLTKVVTPAAKAVKGSRAVQKAIQFLGGGREKAFTEFAQQQAKGGALGSELANLTFQSFEKPLKQQEIIKAKALAEGALKDFGNDARAKLTAKKFADSLKEMSNLIDDFGKRGEVLDRRKILMYAQGVVPTSPDARYEKLVKPFRILQDAGITPAITSTGILGEKTVAKNIGKYTRIFFKGEKPEDVYRQMFAGKVGGKGVGVEIGATKARISETARALEKLKELPETVFKRGAAAQGVTETTGLATKIAGKNVGKLFKDAIKYKNADEYVNAFKQAVTTTAEKGRLFDVAKMSLKDISAFTGKQVPEELRKQILTLKNTGRYQELEQLIVNTLFKDFDTFVNALKNRGYQRAFLHQMQGVDELTKLAGKGKRITKEFINLNADKELLRFAFTENPNLLREVYASTWVNITPAELVKEYERRVRQYGTGVLAQNQAAAEFEPFLKEALGEDLGRMAFQRREDIGMVTDGPLVVAMTVEQGLNLAVTERFLNQTKQFAIDSAEQAIEKGFVQMPNTVKYGSLAGKYVPEIIRDDIVGVIDPTNKEWDKVLNAWKQLKLFSPFNFAPVNRNLINDAVQNSFVQDGPNILKQFSIFPKAIKDYIEGGEVFQTMTKNGVFATSSASREIRKQLGEQIFGGTRTSADKLAQAVEAFTSKGINTRMPGVGFGREAYEYTSDIGKMVQFMHQRSLGKSVDEAIEATVKATFDYSRLPVSLRGVRNAFAPFLTYKYFAAQLMWDTLINRTGKITAIPRATRAIEGLTEEKADERNLPEYIKENRGMYLRTPFLDAQGNPRYLDLSYLVPMGDIGSTDLSSYVLGNPFLKAAVELGTNRNTFLGAPLWDETASAGEKARIAATYLASQFGPTGPYMPTAQGEAPRLLRAARGEQLIKGNEPQLGYEALGALTGFRLREVNPETQARYNYYAFQEKEQEVKSRIRKIMQDEGLSEEKKRERVQKEIDKLRQLAQQ